MVPLPFSYVSTEFVSGKGIPETGDGLFGQCVYIYLNQIIKLFHLNFVRHCILV